MPLTTFPCHFPDLQMAVTTEATHRSRSRTRVYVMVGAASEICRHPSNLTGNDSMQRGSNYCLTWLIVASNGCISTEIPGITLTAGPKDTLAASKLHPAADVMLPLCVRVRIVLQGHFLGGKVVKSWELRRFMSFVCVWSEGIPSLACRNIKTSSSCSHIHIMGWWRETIVGLLEPTQLK